MTTRAKRAGFLRSYGSLFVLLAALAAEPAWGQMTLLPSISDVAGTSGTAGFSGDGGAATSAEFSNPTSVAFDSSGNWYITDKANCRIRKVTIATGDISTIAGNGTCATSGDSGAATSAEINGPNGVAVDGYGNIYIAEKIGNRIRVVYSSGTIPNVSSPVAGDIYTVAGNGTAGSTGDGSAATSAELNAPSGIDVDSSGNIYIADRSNNRVRKVTASTGKISTVAGDGNQCGNFPYYYSVGGCNNNGAATSAELNSPNAVAVDSSGNIFIADNGDNVIREVTISNNYIIGYAGDGTGGFYGDGGAATSGELNGPNGVAVDSSGNVYISDSLNYRIRMVNPATGYISTIAGNGTQGTSGDNGVATSAELDGPNLIAVNSYGNVYFADSSDEEIREVMINPVFPITALGSSAAVQNVYLKITNSEKITSFTVPASQSSKQEFTIGTVSGCSLNTTYSSGTICTLPITFSPWYPGPRNVPLQVVTTYSTPDINFGLSGTGTGPLAVLIPGTISTVAGNGTAGETGNSGLATSAELDAPNRVAVDNAGNIYIADFSGNTVRKVTASTGDISVIAGTGTAGYSGDNGAATSAKLNGPNGVGVDDAGNVYIADSPNCRIRKVTVATGIITTVAGNGTCGYSGDGGAATSAKIYNVSSDIVFDSAGDFIFADSGNNRVREVSISTGVITTIAGNGTAGSTGDSGLATSAELNYPINVAQDSAGNLYIADYNNNKIRKVSEATGIITTVAGNGTAGFTGDGGAATSAELHIPAGVDVDAAGNIYIADQSNNRIRFVDAATGIMTTIAGNGTAGFTGDTGSATAAELNAPPDVTLDNAGNLIIADSSNNRVRQVTVSTSPLTYPTSTAVGTTDSTDDPLTTTVMNAGNASLSVNVPSSGFNPSVSAYFALDNSTTCPDLNTSSSAGTLASGSECTYAVDFEPTIAGSVTGSVVITDNSLGGSATTQTINTSATAIAVNTTTTITSSGTPSTYGTSVTFTATVNPVSGTAVPTGTVQFSIDGSNVGSPVSLSSQTATYSTSTLALGTHSVGAVYAGTANYNTSTASTFTQTVNKATPTVSAWPTASAITYGQTLASSTLTGGTASVGGTFTWTTSSTAPASGTPSESVTFTPTNTTDYNTVTGSVSVTVNKDTPTVTVLSAPMLNTWSMASYGDHSIGEQNGANWQAKPADGAGFMQYGPYTTAVNVGAQNIATWTMMIDNNSSDNNTVANVDVVDSYGATVLASYPITRQMFAATNTLQTFSLPFTAPASPCCIEARVYAEGLATLNESQVAISSPGTATYLQNVVIEATVAPTGSYTPSGTVTFYNGGSSIGSASIDISAGTATITVSSLPVGTDSLTATYAGDTNYNSATASAYSQTVVKATPTCSAWPTASTITYGQTLASSTLTGGTCTVAGTFAWTTSSTAPGAGTPSQGVTFTPTNATDYNTVAGSVSLTVNKATPTVSVWPTASAITYGQTLASSTLIGGTASAAGTFTFTTPSTAPGAGTPSESVTFTPTDTTDYNTPATGSVTVTVNKATPTVSVWPTASAITYGQTLASSTLTGGTASVGGSFAWTTSSTAPGAGTPSESVTFTPSDTTDYNTIAGSVSVTVNKATPTVSTWPTASAITYGQTLSSSTLTGGTASVGGTFAWTTSSTAPGAGTPSESVTFTPTDTTDYNTPATGLVTVTVNKATPTVSTWPTASAITYGQTLASSTLTGGTASVGGTFAWTTSSTAPGAGSQSESVTFTPTDTTDYNTPSAGSVTVTVNKATPTVSVWPTASAITYGQTLASSTLTGGTASVGGTFTWTTPSTAPATGSNSESVTFTPSDTTNYNIPSPGSVTVTVNKATPTVTAWPTASAITYGQTLASSTLSGGTATVAGTFAWTTSSTAPGAGTPSESVTFTPTDTTDYNTPTAGSVTVTVSKATPTVSAWPTASAIVYGQTLASSTLTGGTASVSGSFAWTTSSTAPSAGAISEGVTFTPSETTDYNTVTGSVTVIVYTETTSSTAPTTNVASTSATQTVTMNISFTGTLSTISVLTGGAASLDYAYVSGGTCATGTAYTAGQTCTVKYSFTPAYPGQRLGAILLYTSTPTLMGTAYLSGQGTGPMGLFTTPTQSTLSSVINDARGLSLDGSGNLYVSGWGNNAVYKITPGGTKSTLTSSITEPGGTVVDGAGNLYIGGQSSGTLYEIPAGTTTLNSVATITGGVDNSIVVDSAGNIYAESVGSNNVYQIAAGTNTVTQILTGGQSVTGGTLGRSQGMAIDAGNNLYLADFTNNRLYKVTYGTWVVTTLVNNDGNLNNPAGLAIDPAGNIYVTNNGNGNVIRYSAGTYTAQVFSTSAYTGYAALAMDASGNLYTSVDSNNSVYKYNRNATPTLSYSSTAVGVASTDQIEGFENDGNAALTFSTFAGTNASFNGTDTTCSTSFVLASGSTCNFGVSFQPSTTGSPLTGDANITDNNLNASGTVQQIPVSGTAGADSTSTVLSSSDNPSAFGQLVTFTATVTDTSDGSLTPTGTVQFSIDGSNVGSPVTLSSGTATYATSTLTVGSHNIDAVYTSSSGNYSNSTATTYVQSLNTKSMPTVTSWPTASAITYGQTLASSTLTGGSASVSGTFAWTTSSTAPGAGSPSESVTFTPADTTDYDTPAAGSVTVTVNKATPTVSAWPTSSAIVYGETLAYSDLTGGTASVGGTFAWTASSTAPLAGTPSESVTFTPSDTTDYNVPATGSISVTVNKSSVTINGVTSLTVSFYGDYVTLTYTFTGPGITPTGTTTIKDGGTTLATVSLVSGVATFGTSTLAAGTHTLTAVYNGDSNYQ